MKLVHWMLIIMCALGMTLVPLRRSQERAMPQSGNERVVLAAGPKETRTHYSTSLQITPELLSFNPDGEIECRVEASQAELKKAGVKFRLCMEFAPTESGPWGERGPDGRTGRHSHNHAGGRSLDRGESGL